MTDISVVIPFLNEESNINSLVAALEEFCASVSARIEVIFVDDGSTDGSVKLLSEKHLEHFSGKVVQLSQNYGSHAALRAGINQASGRYTCFLYADLQDPVGLVTKMAEVATSSGSNIVWASRARTNNGFSERLFSNAYSWLMKRYVSPDYPAQGFDIVLFDEKVRAQLNANMEKNSSIFLQILTMGFKQEMITYDKQARQKGKSKWTLAKKVKLLIDSFVAFSYAPLRFVTMMGILFFVFGILYTSYILIDFLIYDSPVQGWTSIIAILSVGIGVTNISLGIIAEYLWRTLDAAGNRKAFLVDQVHELQSKSERS